MCNTRRIVYGTGFVALIDENVDGDTRKEHLRKPKKDPEETHQKWSTPRAPTTEEEALKPREKHPLPLTHHNK